MVLSGVSFVNPTVPQLLRWGANAGPFSLEGESWRILISTYLHGGIIHLGFNMWCLWNLGQLAERIFDRMTYVLIYTACGIGASLASLWWHPMEVSVGASGAIFGLAGALIAALYLGNLPVPKSALRGTLNSLLSFAAYNLIFGAAIKVVDNSAHIGGLVTGLILGAVLARHLNSPESDRRNWRMGVFALTAVMLVASYQWVRQSYRRTLGGQEGQIFQQEPVPLRNPAKSMTIKG